MDTSVIERVADLSKKRRQYKYIQLGVSSRCFLSCIMCPRTCFLNQWKSTNMTIETYTNVARFFPYTENVYLSGWGEPLLNPFFPKLVQLAKQAGCSVGFTTNGALLDEAMGKKMLDLQVDLISVSVAGASAKTHESIRIGSYFKQLSCNIRSLSGLKKSGPDKPKIILLFMMTKKSLDDLPLTIDLAAEIEADGVVATNLDFVATPLHDELKVFSCREPNENLAEVVKKAEERARETGIIFHAFPLEMKSVPVCSENPLNNLYISEEGYVSSCVYLNPPIKEIPRIFCGEKITVPRIRFGNINEQDLFKIWNSPKYISFREKYELRRKGVLNELTVNLPQACRTCYKAYGI